MEKVINDIKTDVANLLADENTKVGSVTIATTQNGYIVNVDNFVQANTAAREARHSMSCNPTPHLNGIDRRFSFESFESMTAWLKANMI